MFRTLLYALAIAVALFNSALAQGAPKGRVLVVLSSANALELRDGRSYETGTFFDEFVRPVRALMEAGYALVFADPDGSPIHFDIHSLAPVYFGGDQAKLDEAKHYVDGLEAAKHPLTLAAVRAQGIDSYIAIVVPGGHAPMQDLIIDRDLGALLRAFHEAGKTTALICHGPLALLSTLPDPAAFRAAMIAGDAAAAQKSASNWPYAGYLMTVFSTSEERFVEPRLLKGQVQFYPAEALAQAGGRVVAGPDRRSAVIRDRELITAQQPFSSDEFAQAVVSALGHVQPGG